MTHAFKQEAQAIAFQPRTDTQLVAELHIAVVRIFLT
jgi:hypothetical protein